MTNATLPRGETSTQSSLPVPERLSVLGLEIEGLLLVGGDIMTLGEWAASVLANGVTIDDLEEARYQYRTATTSLDIDAVAARPVVSNALDTFFKAGLGFEQTARYLGVSAWEVVEAACQGGRGGGKPDVLAILCAERLLALGTPSFVEVSRISGAPIGIIRGLARRFGYVSAAAQRRTSANTVGHLVP